MVVNIKDLSWGSYGGYEGCAYYGRNFYTATPADDFNTKCFAVVASSEGALSSVNMYDRGIISVGAIQWTELTDNKVSEMIGFVAQEYGVELVMKHLKPALDMSGATFRQNAAGKYRFFIGSVEVRGETFARQLFCGGSGRVGTWTDASRLQARTWCAAVATLFQDPDAMRGQIDFTSPQLRPRFITPTVAGLLFGPDSSEVGWSGAVKAFAVAYGVNLPAIVSRVIPLVVASSKYPKWSREWSLDVIKGLVFLSGIKIWPARYNANRPLIEKLFGVELPKTAIELSQAAWRTVDPATVVTPPPPSNEPPPPPEEDVSRPADVIVRPVIEDTVTRPSKDTVVMNATKDDVETTSPFIMLLQWLPMLFGFVGQAINAAVHFFRGTR